MALFRGSDAQHMERSHRTTLVGWSRIPKSTEQLRCTEGFDTLAHTMASEFLPSLLQRSDPQAGSRSARYPMGISAGNNQCVCGQSGREASFVGG